MYWLCKLYQNCHKQNWFSGSFWAQMIGNTKGNHREKCFWPWPPRGATGAKNPFWGQIGPKWKNDYNSVKYYHISVIFSWFLSQKIIEFGQSGQKLCYFCAIKWRFLTRVTRYRNGSCQWSKPFGHGSDPWLKRVYHRKGFGARATMTRDISIFLNLAWFW